jgi:hypothetical protein
MPATASDLPLPVNHVFVDFENVHKVDLAVFASKAVSFTLLVGPRQTKLDASLVEKLFEHAVSVELVRLTSSGKNALDFTLAYYVGRAVAADPARVFHIVSADAGYDPLIAHLRSRHISAFRHSTFETLPFIKPVTLAPAATPTTARKSKPEPQPKSVPASLEEREIRVLDHLQSHPGTRPRTQKTLVRFLIGYLGHKVTEVEALSLAEALSNAGHLVVGDKGKITYHLEAE